LTTCLLSVMSTSSGVEVLEGGKEPHDFSVRITYTREAVEDEEDQPVSEVRHTYVQPVT